MKRISRLLITSVLLIGTGCSRFHNTPTDSRGERYVVISPNLQRNHLGAGSAGHSCRHWPLNHLSSWSQKSADGRYHRAL